MGRIVLDGVTKRFSALEVIKGVSLDIPEGSFTIFVGPSGCGKSTLLRLISGLEPVSGGRIEIDGKDVTNTPPARRGLAMVFQSYALYPHMTVADNIGFGLRTKGMPREERRAAVEKAAAILKLTDYLDRKPKALSGGQRQRVAIGRCIVRQPTAFLFDEPLSNLDAALRVEMRFELADLHRQLGTTMVYVTHDQIEAMTLADQIVVLDQGRVMQVGSPRDLYEKPANLFVAQFIGSPKMNILSQERLRLPNGTVPGADAVGIRPEHLRLGSTEGAVIAGRVRLTEYMGSDSYVYVDTDAGQMLARVSGPVGAREGETVGLSFSTEAAHFFEKGGRTVPQHQSNTGRLS